jgi:hypothetical protein
MDPGAFLKPGEDAGPAERAAPQPGSPLVEGNREGSGAWVLAQRMVAVKTCPEEGKLAVNCYANWRIPVQRKSWTVSECASL